MQDIPSSNRNDLVSFGSTCMIRLLEHCTAHINVVHSLTTRELRCLLLMNMKVSHYCVINILIIYYGHGLWWTAINKRIEVSRWILHNSSPEKCSHCDCKQLLLKLWLRLASEKTRYGKFLWIWFVEVNLVMLYTLYRPPYYHNTG